MFNSFTRMRKEARGLQPFIPELPDMALEQIKALTGLEKIVKLSFNENPFGPSPKAVEAIREAASQLNLYPDAVANGLRDVLAQGYGLTKDHIVLSNGADEMIVLTAQAFLEEGDHVLIPFPTFGQYFASTILMGAVPEKVALNNFKVDIGNILSSLTPRSKLIFLCNPNNPTGTYLSKDELINLLENLPPEVLLVLDEAYGEYVEAPDYISGVSFLSAYPNVLVIRTFSKIYALAGARVGYALANPAIIQAINKVRPPFNLNALGQVAALASFCDREYILTAKAHNARVKKELYDFLQGHGLSFVPSETNFVLIDVGQDAIKLCSRLAEKGIMVRCGSAWGLDSYIRVSLGSVEDMAYFQDQLKKLINI
ncbi:MAG: histidinol-phosphate transaminase [Peptococcaceae bacterium]|uniref:Histidinol-phosphate aminotransferase n=1 Tax=Thermanaerosceptrum fracticalcis TaxID=1712410 RepID=A0A7G6E7S9_THEFR|nr:histidinol-phosphate transaminase [Thermanaerosceptrum fracticalcis]MBZ4654505.1 histidinol-phosphate transaminase [Peptococcaceae bacterium]QNB48133.1 histidinol-phosphate transaminase [Thermanaerosceptrum fracticalcis]